MSSLSHRGASSRERYRPAHRLAVVSSASVPPIRLRPEIAAAGVYRQGAAPAPGAFKLSSNENPFEPLPSVLAAIRDATEINRYPDGSAGAVRAALATRFDVTPEEVLVGPGSVSLFYYLIAAVAAPGDEVVYAWRSFEAYPNAVAVAGATAVEVALTPDARHDLPAMAAAVTDRTRAVVVCSPNNPTSTAVGAEEFARFMDAVPSDVLVLLDEAYVEFVTDPDAVDGRLLLRRYPNLVVLRTFSKAFGLAGLRIGYLIGHPAIVAAVHVAAHPLAINSVSQAAALASLAAETELLERVAVIAERRDGLARELRALDWDIPEAQGNFVWLPTGADTDRVATALWHAGLVTRPYAADGIRVSVGEPESVPELLRLCAELVPRRQNHARHAGLG